MLSHHHDIQSLQTSNQRGPRKHNFQMQNHHPMEKQNQAAIKATTQNSQKETTSTRSQRCNGWNRTSTFCTDMRTRGWSPAGRSWKINANRGPSSLWRGTTTPLAVEILHTSIQNIGMKEKPSDPRQRHGQSRFTEEAPQAMVASPELVALLACLSATLPMYWRLESSRLLRMDAQIIWPTGPRSLECHRGAQVQLLITGGRHRLHPLVVLDPVLDPLIV